MENILNSESKELIQVKKLIDVSNYDEALQLIKDIEENEKTNLHDKISCQQLKCNIFIQQGLYDKAFKLAEKTYESSLELGKNLLSVDALILMAESLIMHFKLEGVLEILEKGEEILDTLTELKPRGYKQRKATIIFFKGRYYGLSYKTEYFNMAVESLEQSLLMRRELGIKHDLINPLIKMALFRGMGKCEIDLGLKYATEGLKLAEESKSKYLMALSMQVLMTLYSLKGEFDRSLMYAQQSLTLFEEINNIPEISRVLTQIGDKYIRNGDFKRSLEYLERSLALHENLSLPSDKATLLGTLIEAVVALGDIKLAKHYLKQLEQLNEQEQNNWINLAYRLDKALILKTSSRAKDRVKAEKLLKEIIEEYGDDFAIMEAFVELCDLLLFELQITNDYEVLKEIEHYVERLLAVSKKSNSFWVLGETYLLQAKLALIKLDLSEARQLLTQGQQIAEEYGLKLLAIKISNEHDELFKELGKWEYFKQTKSSLEERLKLSRLSEQMEIMAKKRVVEPKDLLYEIPVVILIMSKGGTPIFSQIFAEEWAFQDHLFGGFLTAVNNFSNEMFSKGLDRAIFGNYTLLMKSATPFLVCYLFKGQSYLAQQRIKYFVDNIQTNNNIWQGLNRFHQTNQEIQLKDIPSLKPIISEIFIEKQFPLEGLESHLK